MNKVVAIKIGDTFTSNEGVEWKVLQYKNSSAVIVESSNGTVKTVKASGLRKGHIRCNLHPSVFGTGYLGRGDYSWKTHRKAYQTWRGMLERCYDPKCQAKFPTYIGCTVHPNWHNFQNFAQWFEENHIEGFHLDKDIKIYKNKIYSPSTCLFVPPPVNSFIIDRSADRGQYVLGVYWSKSHKKFAACINNLKKSKHLGHFTTEREAFEAYAEAKMNLIESLDTMDDIKSLIRDHLTIKHNEIRQTKDSSSIRAVIL